MFLTNEQIQKVTFGALQVVPQADGIHFYKCTPEQQAAWNTVSEELGERSKCTTGVSLDFHTNSKTVSFTVTGTRFELLIDGLLVQTSLAEEGTGPRVITQQLTGKEQRVTLVFPSHGPVGILNEVELENGATLAPHTFDRKFLFIGDSLTQGWDSGTDTLSYAWRVSNFFNAERVINGIGGAVYEPKSFAEINFDPDVVFIAYGTNDYNRYASLQQLHEKAYGFLEQVKKAYSQKQIFVILPTFRFDLEKERAMGSFEACRAEIQAVCDALALKTVDGYTLIPHSKELFKDVVHPSALGFSYYAENIIKILLAEFGK